MENTLPGGKEASYRLLGLQALVHDGGVILKRGATRLFLDGDHIAELVDFLVDRLSGGRTLDLEPLIAEVKATQRPALRQIVETLIAHRFLIAADNGAGDGGGAREGRGREEVFFWNYQRRFADIVGELADTPLTVFGVNAIGLALLGNLRGCGFRDITFVDHPTLRNYDYFDAKRQLRPEISGALAVSPVPFDEWSADRLQAGGCFVVCCDFGGRPLMRDWNRFCIENGVLFYPILLLDHVAHLGPIVVPGEGPCYECLWVRQNANFVDAARLRAGEVEPESGQHAIGYLQPMARAAADFAAIDLLKTLSKSLAGRRIGRTVEIDLLEPAITSRDLVKVPHCPVCSQAPEPTEETEAENPKPDEEAAPTANVEKPSTDEAGENSGKEPSPETNPDGAS